MNTSASAPFNVQCSMLNVQCSLLLFVLLSFVIRNSAQSAVVYTSTPIPIPLDFDGVYLNPITTATTNTQPADWNTAPWLNPFFGGVYFGNDDLLRPVITGADQIVNLAAGTQIDGSSNFVAGESGSSTHIGAALNQFQLGVPGYIGFTFQPTVGGSTYYGWASVTFSNSGPGSINGYAYDDTPGTGILAGDIGGAPEPSRAMLLMLGLTALLARRRRSGQGE